MTTSVSSGPSSTSLVRPAATRSGPGSGGVAGFFVTRSRRVEAMLHDGTPDSTTRLTQWVLRASAEVRATAGVWVDGHTLVVDLLTGQVFVHTGTVLVLDRAAANCWSVVPLAQFSWVFVATARELPVFDDGEVV